MKLLTQPLARWLVLMGLMVLSASSFAQTCPTGSTLSGAACVANPGYYGSGRTFAACPAGTWQRNGAQNVCILADAGTYVPTTGTFSDPIACPVNTYSVAPAASAYPNTANAVGATSCSSCPANSTTASSGSTSASSCKAPAGYYLAAGATSVTACAAGSYSAAGAASCTLASAGSYVATAGATAQTACPAGSYSAAVGAASCTQAAAGSAAYGTGANGSGATAQRACNPATYSANPGAGSCTPVTAGYYVATPGATAQTACPSGYTNIGGSGMEGTSCSATGPINTANNGTCSAGHSVYKNSATTYTCQLCSANYFNSSVTVSANKLAVGGYAGCTYCTKKTNSVIGSTACQ